MAAHRIAAASLIAITAIHAQEEAPLETRVHDLSWLPAEPRHAPFVVKPYGALLLAGESRFGDDEVETPAGAEASPPGLAGAEAEASAADGVDALLQILRTAANDGGEESGLVRVVDGRLHVTAAPAFQQVAAAAIDELERAFATRVTVECLTVPLAALERHAPRWRETGPLLPTEAFEACLGEPQARLLTAAGRPGQRLASAPRRAHLFNTTTEINQTGVIPVNQLVIAALLGGDRLEARALLHPASGSVHIDLALGRYLWSPRRLDMGPDLGVYGPPAGTQEVLSTTVIVPQGKAAVAASLESPDLAVLVRAKVQPPAPPAPRSLPGGESVRTYELAALIGGPARRWPAHAPRAAQVGTESVDPRDALVLLGLGRSKDEAGSLSLELFGSRAMLLAEDERQAQARQAYLESLERAWRAVQIEVGLWRLPRAVYLALRQAAGDGGTLAADWEKAILGQPGLERRRFSASGVAGAQLGIFAAATRSYAVDVSQVSGGTGFALMEASQADLRTCGSGVDLRLEAHLRGADRARLRLEGASATVLEEREVEAAFPTTLYLTESSRQASEVRPTGSAQSNQPVGAIKRVRLTLPVQQAHRWSVDLDVPLGRDVILDADLAEDGTATVLIGRVRGVESAP